MKLDYFDLISPLPLDLVGIGRIKSPKLIEIADISYYVYAQYVSCLRMTPSDPLLNTLLLFAYTISSHVSGRVVGDPSTADSITHVLPGAIVMHTGCSL